jgi:predicted ATPase
VRHELPSGEVTFLFTDIEGSTRLLHQIGDGYIDVLSEHRRVLRDAFLAHGGVEVDTQGDAFFVAFADATAAVTAAVAAQEALALGPVRVRMGVHTGAPVVTDEGYVGRDVHLGARIAAAAHGGQILLSRATRELVDAEMLDLGEHRLKDFEQPVWLFQAGRRQFPPLRTIANTNLPRPASSFVGRVRELDELTNLLRDARFVTVTGPGGAGKTRLAIEAAGRTVTDFANGAFWIPLANVRDASLVPMQIAETLGIDAERVASELKSRRLLLLLDNFEHVIDAAPLVASLVEECPGLVVLVTSREPLRVRGERHYALETLAEQEAVELFCERARATATAAVVSLCRGLDNLPLAVELAAARATLLSPDEILARIAERLDLLRGGRDADHRQGTLRATIDWSVQLLDAAELHVFTALSVFVGGCTVAAAEVVGGALLDELQSLIEKSLLRRADGRLFMLETVREYARERLAASDTCDELEQRHARYYLDLAQASVGQLYTAPPAELMSELPNIRAAVAFAARRGDVALEFSLLGQTTELMNDSLPRYRTRLEELLAADPAVEPAVPARGVGNLGFAAYLAGDLERAKQLAQLEYDIGVNVSEWFESAALNSLSSVYLAEGNRAAARDALERALVLNERTGARRAAAITKINLADTLVVEGDYAAAASLCGDASTVFAELDDPTRMMIAQLNGATAAVFGVLPQASDMVVRALQTATRMGDGYGTAVALQLVAALAARMGDAAAAAVFIGAADELRARSGHGLEPTETRVREAILANGVEPAEAPDPEEAVVAAQSYLSEGSR